MNADLIIGIVGFAVIAVPLVIGLLHKPATTVKGENKIVKKTN